MAWGEAGAFGDAYGGSIGITRVSVTLLMEAAVPCQPMMRDVEIVGFLGALIGGRDGAD